MRCLIPLLIVLLSLNVLALDSKEIYNQWIEGYKTYNVSGMPLFLSAPGDMDIVYIKFGSETISIANDTCDAMGIYTICYGKNRFARYNTKTDTEVYEFNIKISVSSADVKITKSISENPLYPDEKALVTISLQNIGVLPAESLQYTEILPGLDVEEYTGCSVSGNKVTLETKLNPDDTKYCRFYVHSSREINATSSGNYSYFNGKETVTKASADMKIVFMNPELVLKMNITEDVAVGENLTITVSIMNRHETNQISARAIYLKVPPSFETVSLKSERFIEWIRTGDGIRIEQWIPAKGNRTFSLVLRPLRSGIYNLTYEGYYDIGPIRRQVGVMSQAEVTISSLGIVDASNRTIFSGERKSLELYVGNREEGDYAFRDIEIDADCFGIAEKISFPGILAKEFIPLFSKGIIAPNVSEDTNITCIFDMGYSSEYGERFSKRITVEYLVLAKTEDKSVITYNRTISKEIPEEEEELIDMIPENIRKNKVFLIMLIPIVLLIVGLVLFIRHRIDYKKRILLREIKIEAPVEEKKETLEVAEPIAVEEEVEPIKKKKKVKPSKIQ